MDSRFPGRRRFRWILLGLLGVAPFLILAGLLSYGSSLGHKANTPQTKKSASSRDSSASNPLAEDGQGAAVESTTFDPLSQNPQTRTAGSGKKIYPTGRTIAPRPPHGWPRSPYAQDQNFFPGSRLVEEMRVPLVQGGTMAYRILQVDNFKYPFIRVEAEEDSTGTEVKRTEMVADHLMVSLRPGVNPANLGSWFVSQGAAIRKASFLGAPTLVKTEEISLAALPQLLEVLESRPDLFAIVETDDIQHPQKTPNDARYAELYGMLKISAPASWDIRTDASSVVVAVIDTGVRYTHEDLKDNMWKNAGETGTDSQGRSKETNGVDDEGNGVIDDVYGYDAANEDGDPMDQDGHGSHCSGTIAGRGNNNLGVVGVAWIGKIMAVKFLDPFGTTSDAILSVNYARSKGAKVSSNSWGGGGYSVLLEAAIREMNTAGCLFIASAGNAASDTDRSPQYPACYNVPNVISVAATDANDGLASFSNIGLTTVDLGAPGVDVLSSTSDTDSSYEEYSGTSMACPHVSGAFALLAAQYPNKTIAQLISAVLGNTDPLPALNGKCVTGGRLNALKAMNALSGGGGGGGGGGGLALNNSYSAAWPLNSALISSTVDGSRITRNGQSFWWTWTAPATGRLRVDTSKSSARTDTTLTAYTGSSLATLKVVASNNNFSQAVRWSGLDLGVTKGTRLTFKVDGVQAGQSLVLQGTQGSAAGPANDFFGTGTVLSGTSFVLRGSNFNATTEAGEPGHGGYTADNSVWFVWTPSTASRVTLSTLGSAIDTRVAVYTGDTVDALTLVASNDNASRSATHSQLTFTPRAGTTYRIALDSKYRRPGSYQISIR